jgi:hypothetical protein
MSCPKCGRVFNVKELMKVLEGSGVSEKTIKTVKKELVSKQVAEAI